METFTWVILSCQWSLQLGMLSLFLYRAATSKDLQNRLSNLTFLMCKNHQVNEILKKGNFLYLYSLGAIKAIKKHYVVQSAQKWLALKTSKLKKKSLQNKPLVCILLDVEKPSHCPFSTFSTLSLWCTPEITIISDVYCNSRQHRNATTLQMFPSESRPKRSATATVSVAAVQPNIEYSLQI